VSKRPSSRFVVTVAAIVAPSGEHVAAYQLRRRSGEIVRALQVGGEERSTRFRALT
jgi:hypothetical protein